MVSLGTSIASAYDPWTVQSRVGLTDARFALDSVLMPRSGLSYIDYRSGVFASGDTGGVGGSSHQAMRVKPGSGLSVTVEMGNAAINVPGQGAYMCALDSQKTLSLAAAGSTTNRIDLIIARVYDDLNPGIASATGVRKFAVEVWQGDPSTGTPTQPTPTPTAGWTPLAAVTVNKGALSLSTANIRDLRGPGLVARGGMRALYGEDAQIGSPAFQEAGAFPGDQRWVHTNGFQHQVYYGSQDGWRGVHNCLVYGVNPPPGGIVWTRGVNSIAELCRVKVPYPGTPYMVEPVARGFLYLSYNTAVDLRITLDSINGPTINWERSDSFGTSSDHTMVWSVPGMKYGPITTDRDVVLSAAVRECPTSAHGFGFAGNDTGQTYLQVSALPSTVQPPAV